VWIQLLRFYLRYPACRQALLSRSSGAAAAPAELMLAQLTATLAEELAASPYGFSALTSGCPEISSWGEFEGLFFG
jgi:hypothetical protein